MFLLIDKPKGITSHDVVDRIREMVIKGPPSLKLRPLARRSRPMARRSRRVKVGHAGTLDPNATGLLVVGIGRESTKKLGSISKDTKKKYEAKIFLGEERDTDDAEGEILRLASLAQDDKEGAVILLSLSNVRRVLKKFVGEQMQMPPVYSAIKVKGKKAYELARKGRKVKLKPRKIVIYSIKLTKYDYPLLEIICTVSSGTYIRALARDIGRKLNCGAYLADLRRTKIGKFDIKDAIKLDLLTRDSWRDFAFSLGKKGENFWKEENNSDNNR